MRPQLSALLTPCRPPPCPFPTLMTPYATDASRYDELLAADGSMRAHWRPLVEGWKQQGRMRHDVVWNWHDD